MDLTVNAERCTGCGICRENCGMLSKYGAVIGDLEKIRELAYSCFLCGECSRVCPEGIDGRGMILELRKEFASENLPDLEKKYKSAFGEKKDYTFRNYNRATEGTVYFPGCSFPSFYPRTSEYISKLLKDEYGIGTVYDCCGKPIAELGSEEDERKIIQSMEERFAEAGITELITACPNCRDYLESHLSIKVTDIFAKLGELGLGEKIGGGFQMYIPCPDREEKKWLKSIGEYVNGDFGIVSGVNCCGLGGQAGYNEPELATGFTALLKEQTGDAEVYTYCASCAGNYARNGAEVKHLLPTILGTNEKTDTKFSYINRAKLKLKK